MELKNILQHAFVLKRMPQCLELLCNLGGYYYVECKLIWRGNSKEFQWNTPCFDNINCFELLDHKEKRKEKKRDKMRRAKFTGWNEILRAEVELWNVKRLSLISIEVFIYTWILLLCSELVQEWNSLSFSDNSIYISRYLCKY